MLEMTCRTADQVWHDAGLEFAQALEDFINNCRTSGPTSGNRFVLFLQDQRDRGFKVDEASYQRLRTVLEEFRDDLIADGVDLQQTYTPSAEQNARERASIRERNERCRSIAGSYYGVYSLRLRRRRRPSPAATGPATAAPAARSTVNHHPPVSPGSTTTTLRPAGHYGKRQPTSAGAQLRGHDRPLQLGLRCPGRVACRRAECRSRRRGRARSRRSEACDRLV